MDLRKVFLILALAAGGLAQADIFTKINAVETITSNVSVPTAPNGRLMFRPCDAECDEKFVIVRLTGDTQYFVNERAVDFTEFRRQFFNRRSRADDYALVSYDTESSTATSVTIAFE